MFARRQWVREEDLAKELKLNTKQLRTILRYFEEQQFIMRVHRKEVCADISKHFFLYSALLLILNTFQ